MFIKLEEVLLLESILFVVLCFGFDIKVVIFDGCYFYDKESGV